jgi:hypothetical protein
MDRDEARRRRRRKGHLRLAVLIACVALVIVVVVLLTRGCGGREPGQAGVTPSAPGQAAGGGESADAATSPKPVSSSPPLVSLGDTVRFETPEQAVVRVTVDDYADPGEPTAGVAADDGERLVTLKLSVVPEGEPGTAAVPLPFHKADSFVLVMEDDELAAAMLGDDGLLGAVVAPGKSTAATLAFSVGASPPIRFVCTPIARSTPRSATWELE